MYHPNNQKVGIINAKAKRFLTPEETAFFIRVAPTSYIKKPTWMITINAVHHQ